MEPSLTDSPNAATLVMQPLDGVQIEAPLIRILPNFGPSSTWTVQNSLDNTDACMPLVQDCPPSLIESTTGH